MGWNNPPVPWSELERRLSGRPYNAYGGDSPAWSNHRGDYRPPPVAKRRTVTFGKPTTRRVNGFQAGVVGLLLGLGVAMCLAVVLTRRQQPPVPAPPRRLTRAPESVT